MIAAQDGAVVAGRRAPNLDAVIAAVLDSVVGDREAETIGREQGALGDGAEGRARNVSAAAFELHAMAEDPLDGAIGDA